MHIYECKENKQGGNFVWFTVTWESILGKYTLCVCIFVCVYVCGGIWEPLAHTFRFLTLGEGENIF